MNSLLCATLVLGLALQVNSQQACNDNNRQCTSGCLATTNPNNCCILDSNETVSMNFNSDTPLGFTRYNLPGSETGVSPPCMRVPLPGSAFGQAGVYLVVGIETEGTNICVEEVGNPRAPTCGSGAVFFCEDVAPMMAAGATFVELAFCQDAPCEAADSPFFIKPDISIIGSNVENFCDDNGQIPLPSSLLRGTGIVPDRPMSTIPTQGGASVLKPLLLLLLSAVILARWL